MRKKISQREARATRKELDALKREISARHTRYARDYPGGVHIATIDVSAMPEYRGRIWTAQVLQHAVVARLDQNDLYLFAVPTKAA